MTNSTTYLMYVNKILKYSSMYNIRHIKNGPTRYLFYSLRIFWNVINLLLIYGTAMYIVKIDLEDFDTLTWVVFFLLASTLSAFRLNYFYIYGRDCESIVRDLRKIFVYTTRTGLEEIDMKHYVYVTNKFPLIYLTYLTVFGVTYHVVPVIHAFISTQERKLPIPVYCPYNCQISPYYELTIFLQTLMQFVVVIAVGVPDLFFWCLLYLLNGQFQLLGWELKNSLYTVLLRNGFEKNVILNFRKHLSESNQKEIMIESSTCSEFQCVYDTVNTEKFTRDYIKKFGKLADLHQSLMSFSDEVNKLFSPLILHWCIQTVLLNLICGFLFLMTDYDIVVIINLLGYYIALVFALLCPCVLAEIVKTRSEQLQDILYSTEWYICQQKFKKVFLLMQLSLSKPTTFTVGKFSDLHLPVFVSIMKTSYSYFVIMRQIIEMKRSQ